MRALATGSFVVAVDYSFCFLQHPHLPNQPSRASSGMRPAPSCPA